MKARNVSWDRDLTLDEFRKLPRMEKHLRVVTSIERKVVELEVGWQTGRLSKQAILKLAGNRTRFRQWHDPKKGLWRWSLVDLDCINDPKTGLPGPNASLMLRWDAVIKRARAPVRNEAVSSSEPPRTTELERQYIEALARVALLEESLAKATRSGSR
ncbi:hypothetical protein [Rhizobium ruizarguesonis]|uniref:hypothetical protein n=1 Tax=Rhizobium ruizarguesonis TaxID=2081791 RepID=UPI00102F3716|nr:hypothetical protein [Rhizobium ruizarguesonis]TAT84802.1 hypothetical protein ELI52_15510 [Rhizobium ruizarguesonis]